MAEYIERIKEKIDNELEEAVKNGYLYEVSEDNFIGCSKAFAWHGLGASSGEKAVAKWLPKLYAVVSELNRCDPSYKLEIAKMVVDWANGNCAEELRLTCKSMKEGFKEEMEKDTYGTFKREGFAEDLDTKQKNIDYHLNNLYNLSMPVSTGEW